MKRKLLLVSLVCLIVCSLVFSGCTEETTPAPEASSPTSDVTTPTTTAGNWWNDLGEPKYGGTITLRVAETSDLNFDTIAHPWTGGYGLLHYDSLFTADWTADRADWSFKTTFTPDEYSMGSLAESWEQPDAQTVVVKIKEGVHFQDREPVNGRELTADDIKYSYDRMCGTGSGFTEPSSFFGTFTNLVESINVVDQYTVEFTFVNANAVNLSALMAYNKVHYIEAPEITQQGLDPADWHNAVGTGPWILEEFTDGTSVIYTKNPNYFGADERYPDNRLPYADQLKIVAIPDSTTALSALRTGQVSILEDINWQTAQSFAKSNPELLQSEIPMPGTAILMNMNNAPFNDIQVRKAMEMAVDRELIAQTHYGGTVDGKPCGQVNPMLTGYAYPYDEWPAELQAEYTYNPEGAKEILTSAGYPDGFSTTIITPGIADIECLEIIKSMFSDVGIDMEIQVLDMGAMIDMMLNAKHELGVSETELGATGQPWTSLKSKTPFFINPSTVNDPDFNNMIVEIESTTDTSKIAKMCADADLYLIEHHWQIAVCPKVSYNLWQSSLKGYDGELLGYDEYFARWWIDEE